ncbi:hypothetical protein FACS189435_3180 [Bacteroidia bacterium]|nr:hypothetical protein FACS189435_3180 [Bacteroidia bacterium]
MVKERKSRAFLPVYESPGQLKLPGFEHPFERGPNQENRWAALSRLIPRDELCAVYRKHAGTGNTGRPGLSPRTVAGSLVIKCLCNLDGREAVGQVPENICVQYFPGYPSFSREAPFGASLFVDLRKRMGMDAINALNDRIASLKVAFESKKQHMPPGEENPDEREVEGPGDLGEAANRGRITFDATACPQGIACPQVWIYCRKPAKHRNVP